MAQTLQPDEWIVSDGGVTPAPLTLGQVHLRQPGPRGARNFLTNLARAIPHVTGDVVVFWEDDDYYAPTHLARIVAQLQAPDARAAGDDEQRYYHLPSRQWRVFQNRGASLCQTAVRKSMLPVFAAVVKERLAKDSYGADTFFWSRVPPRLRALERTSTVVGLKGLPGTAGLGIGHRPTGAGWQRDPRGERLREWLGADADVYLGTERR